MTGDRDQYGAGDGRHRDQYGAGDGRHRDQPGAGDGRHRDQPGAGDGRHRDQPGAGNGRHRDQPRRPRVAEEWPTDRPPPQEVASNPSHRGGRAQSRHLRAARERRRRRRIGFIAALAVLVMIVVAAVYAGQALFGRFGQTAADYSGPGVRDIVVQVKEGETASDIAGTLETRDVVASAQSFVTASLTNSSMNSIQPGYYRLRTQIPASDAVDRLTAWQSRVGQLVIAEGRQLDDVTSASGQVTKGIYTLISDATCVELDGARRCVSTADLRSAAADDSLSDLGVPEWATTEAAAVPDKAKRLEGLIRPGSWDVDPSAGPTQLLRQLVSRSAQAFARNGLIEAGVAANMTPYQVLVVASLVEREARPDDFAKVARVIFNRLLVNQKLEFDSTVNYPLDRQAVATTDTDRATVTPWNTYAGMGLPATPISSPSDGALAAAEHPAPGDWLFFVTVDKEGTTVFVRGYEEHLANIEIAKANGVLDYGQ